ncbi:MAG: hypothetical protein MJ200_04450 [Mycoplasmoidaceae bacterium]|nr:hypothetical protein [Mycoplasmoidaceae bacterium]
MKPNAYVNIATMYYDSTDSENNIFLNKFFDKSILGSGVSAVKNDKPMTVKGNNQYYLTVDTKN